MNIYQISNKSGLSLTALRKLEKLGVLKVGKDAGAIEQLHFYMARNKFFTAPQIMQLLDEPGLIDELGFISKLYQQRAIDQLGALGDVQGSTAPAYVTAALADAAAGDMGAAAMISIWLKTVLPVEPVYHPWIAARLLLPLNEFLRTQNAPKINLALAYVRKLPEFAAYWHPAKPGSRGTVEYHKSKVLDL